MQQTSQQKVIIKMKGYDSCLLEKSIRSIILTVSKSGACVAGPVFLPSKCQKFTVNRSPHVDKKSREQFEMTSCSRLLILSNASAVTIQLLTSLQLPPGVYLKIKVTGGSVDD